MRLRSPVRPVSNYLSFLYIIRLCETPSAVLLISTHHGAGCEETYLRSKTSVFVAVFTCLFRSCLVNKGRSRQQAFRGSNNNRVRPFCQQLQQAVFSQSSLRLEHTLFFKPLHLSKPIEGVRNISHLYGLVKSPPPRGAKHTNTLPAV